MSDNKRVSISPVSDGPYLVKNLTKLSSQKGDVETDETIALCRCGKSENKPFCDGAHARVGFTSENEKKSSNDKCINYVGKQITIHDNRNICAHAGVCTDNLAAVFRMKQEPWIDPDAVAVPAIISVIQQCPSGALSYTLEGERYTIDNQSEKFFIAPNGPYVVAGCPELNDTDWGEAALQQQYTLCRCGASKNKPFCDGSHWAVEFVDEKN